MIGLELAAALICVLYGALSCVRKKQPLFFKLLLYAMASYLLGTLFTACFVLVYGHEPQGFHVGILGRLGAYFFLLSSYYGAIDRLADGGEARYRVRRLVSTAGPLAVLALMVGSVRISGWEASISLVLTGIPMGLALYFAIKHLILPDVDLGIIEVMRPYNVCFILFGIVQAFVQAPVCSGTGVHTAMVLLSCILLLSLLPMAEMGVRKWFI